MKRSDLSKIIKIFEISSNLWKISENFEALNQKWGFWGFPNGHFKLWQVPPIIYTSAFLYFDMWQSYAHNNFQPLDLSFLKKSNFRFTFGPFSVQIVPFWAFSGGFGWEISEKHIFFQYFDSASGRCNILLSFLALIVKGSLIGSPLGYHPPPWKNWVKLNAISIPIS